MAEYATIAFRTQEPLTTDKLIPVFARLPGALATSPDGSVLRVRLHALFPRHGVVIAAPPESASDTGSASPEFLIALEDRPGFGVLVWGTWGAIALLLMVAALAVTSVPDTAITSGAAAAALWLAARWFAVRTGLTGVSRAFKQHYGAQMVVIRRTASAGAPMQLREALYAWTAAAKAASQKSAREGSIAAPATGNSFSIGAVVVPAVVSGIFSLTAAVVIFGLESGRIEEEKAIREHERQMEELRSQRALGADAVRFYFENRERLAVGDETSRRMMAVLSAISPPHINCVLQEAYRGDAPQEPPVLATYSANTLAQVVQIARQRSFSGDSVEMTCIGSSDRQQVTARARIDGYQPPQGGERFMRNPSGGGGERLETDAPPWPEGRAARETVVFVFAQEPELAITSQRADDLFGANYLVSGIFQSDFAPRTPTVVFYDDDDRGAAELLASLADYWTYVDGARSEVRVVRGDARERRAQGGYLELWLPS